jgi:hypothetical protein
MARWLLVALVLLIAAGVGVYYGWFRQGPEEVPEPIHETTYSPVSSSPRTVTEAELLQRQLVGSFSASPSLGLPGGFPWQAVVPLAPQLPSDYLPRVDPVRYLETCLERYEQEVQGYSLTFVKKERIKGKLHPPAKDKYEIIRVSFREKPFSVLFEWKENPRNKLAAKCLYVEGENKNKIVAKGVIPFVKEYAVDGPDARDNGRYTIAEFGLGKAQERTVAAMRKAEARGALHVRYEGQVSLDEVGGRKCYKFIRTPYQPTEEEGVNELTLYIDCENGLQIGSILRDPEGQLIAEYFFRDIELNPAFSEKQFTRGGL